MGKNPLDVLQTQVNSLAGRVTQAENRLAELNEAIRAAEGRLTEIGVWREDVDLAVRDHWLLRDEINKRRTAERLDDLERFADENREFIALHREAVRALFTLMHPDPAHTEPMEPVPEEELPAIEEDPMAHSVNRHRAIEASAHAVVMDWIEKLGGRIPDITPTI